MMTSLFQKAYQIDVKFAEKFQKNRLQRIFAWDD